MGSLPSSRGQEEELPHKTEMDKGLLLPEPISDTTTCPKGTCGPRQTSFPDLWTESHSVFFPHLHDVKKKKKMSHAELSFVEKFWQVVPN